MRRVLVKKWKTFSLWMLFKHESTEEYTTRIGTNLPRIQAQVLITPATRATEMRLPSLRIGTIENGERSFEGDTSSEWDCV